MPKHFFHKVRISPTSIFLVSNETIFRPSHSASASCPRVLAKDQRGQAPDVQSPWHSGGTCQVRWIFLLSKTWHLSTWNGDIWPPTGDSDFTWFHRSKWRLYPKLGIWPCLTTGNSRFQEHLWEWIDWRENQSRKSMFYLPLSMRVSYGFLSLLENFHWENSMRYGSRHPTCRYEQGHAILVVESADKTFTWAHTRVCLNSLKTWYTPQILEWSSNIFKKNWGIPHK